MGFSAIIDVLLLVLLCMMLFYAIRLSRQYGEIKQDQDKLASLIEGLNKASARAEKSITSMRETALDTGEKLQSQTSKGVALFDELEIMIEAGDSLAERLQVIAAQSRKTVSGGDDKKKPAKKVAPKKNKETDARSRAEKELIEALSANNDKGRK